MVAERDCARIRPAVSDRATGPTRSGRWELVSDPGLFGRELRRARERLGLTQEETAKLLNVSLSLYEKAERGAVPPSQSLSIAADTKLHDGVEAAGFFSRLRDHGLHRNAVREWLRDWLSIEQQADMIRWYEPDLVPGLLQTRGYASALITREAAVVARLERQQILDRDEPPEVVVIIGEHVLHRRVGSPEVMYEQLATLAEDRRVVIQVLPLDAETYAGCDGSFVLGAVGDRTYVYVDTPARGFTLEDREIVSRVQAKWEAIRGEALTARQSRELIFKQAERWKTNSG